MRPIFRNKTAILAACIAAAAFIVSCGGNKHPTVTLSNLVDRRLVASQSVLSPTAFPGLVIINGANDTIARAATIQAGTSPGLMTLSPNRGILMSFDSASNSVDIIDTAKEMNTGSIPVSGPTVSMVAMTESTGYAAVPSFPFASSQPPGAVLAMNLGSGSLIQNIPVPGAQWLAASPTGDQMLVFQTPTDNVTGTVTVLSQLEVNTGYPVVSTLSGFDHPANAVFSSDGSTAYVMNCGPECGSASASASVQVVNMISASGPALVGSPIPVDGATIGFLSGSTLYVAGTPTASVANPTPNNACTGETTAATVCGRVDTLNVGTTPPTVTASATITDGYHDRIEMSVNGQLFIGSYACTEVGNVNDPVGEVRGCLSILNTSNNSVVIPPDNGDVTGLQMLTSQYVIFVAEGGNLRVYSTLIDSLLIDEYITTGTVTISGQIIDVKAIDFF
jgi:hypothetical protein